MEILHFSGLNVMSAVSRSCGSCLVVHLLCYWEAAKLFSSMAVPFYIPARDGVSHPSFSPSLSSNCRCRSILIEDIVLAHCGFNLLFPCRPVLSEHLFICLFASCMASLLQCLCAFGIRSILYLVSENIIYIYIYPFFKFLFFCFCV